MSNYFDTLQAGQRITGQPFSPTRESIREFCEASLDFNPLHLDDNYMKGSFGKTTFDGIIMHDTITPAAVVTATRRTERSRWATLDVTVTNQLGETVATGEAMVEFPPAQ